MEVTYQVEKNLTSKEFIELLNKSTLAERRPVDDIERIEMMLQNATIIVTARVKGKLVGVSRAISDLCYCTYLSDLAVDEAYQHQGIGKRLIVETKRVAGQGKLILLSAPKAVDYYPRIGMQKMEHCFVIDHEDQILFK